MVLDPEPREGATLPGGQLAAQIPDVFLEVQPADGLLQAHPLILRVPLRNVELASIFRLLTLGSHRVCKDDDNCGSEREARGQRDRLLRVFPLPYS